jgi:hypothetical protein
MKAYKLKVTLQGAEPPVWRRIVVPAGIKFNRLGAVITEAMGWAGCLPCTFRFEKERLLIRHRTADGEAREEALPSDGGRDGYETADAREISITDLLMTGAMFRFDRGADDAWVHEVKVERMFSNYPNDCPRVTAYAGDCPLENTHDTQGGPPEPEQAVWRRDLRLPAEYDMDRVNESLLAMPTRSRRDAEHPAQGAAEDKGGEKAYGATPAGSGSFLSIVDRIYTMSDDELTAVFENPETLFGYTISFRDPVFDLRGLFESFSLKELQALASEMQLPGRSGLRKIELIEAVYDQYIEANILFPIMCQMNDKEMQTLRDIMDSDIYYVEDADFPYKFALTLLFHNIITAFYDGDRIAIVSFRELKEKYIEVLDALQHFLDKALTVLDEYACAAVNLYGAISMDDFMRIYLEGSASDLDEATTRRVLSDIIGEEEDSESPYRLRGEILFSDDLEDLKDDELETLVEYARAYPRHLPPQEQFLAYADWLYFEETPAHREFADFIRDKEGKDPEDKALYATLVGEICSILRQWAPMQECFDILESFDIKFRDLKDTKRVTKLIAQMRDNTRMWGQNGMTPNELRAHKQDRALRKHAEGKVGRNDPCPCGSGKKYKHCCGRLPQ